MIFKVTYNKEKDTVEYTPKSLFIIEIAEKIAKKLNISNKFQDGLKTSWAPRGNDPNIVIWCDKGTGKITSKMSLEDEVEKALTGLGHKIVI